MNSFFISQLKVNTGRHGRGGGGGARFEQHYHEAIKENTFLVFIFEGVVFVYGGRAFETSMKIW